MLKIRIMEKKSYTLLFLFIVCTSWAQKFNVKDYGANGNGKTDDTEYFMKALSEIKQKFSSQKKQAVLYIPSGNYVVSKSIILDKYTSLEGEFVNTTVLRIKSSNTPLVILEKNFNESEIYNSYNYVRNLTLHGTDYLNIDNYNTPRTIPATETNNTGIQVNGLRTRIENMQIEGFLNNGIEVKGSYYTFITRVFLKNNATGLIIKDLSTSVYLTESELRFNSIAIAITNYSFANFISNNMIESNVARFYTTDMSLQQGNTNNSMGRGIVLNNAASNIITNNYFENHFVNITLLDATKNIINNNFITLSDNMAITEKNQVSLQLLGKSTDNIFENNSFLLTREHVTNKMIIGNNFDYSSNKIDVGTDNQKIKNLLKKTIKDEKLLPKITN